MTEYGASMASELAAKVHQIIKQFIEAAPLGNLKAVGQLAEVEVALSAYAARASRSTQPIELRELLCQKCGRDYPVWFAPNALWNKIADEHDHFLCMDCFAILAESKGVKPTVWMVSEENIELSDALEKLRRLEDANWEGVACHKCADPQACVEAKKCYAFPNFGENAVAEVRSTGGGAGCQNEFRLARRRKWPRIPIAAK